MKIEILQQYAVDVLVLKKSSTHLYPLGYGLNSL